MNRRNALLGLGSLMLSSSVISLTSMASEKETKPSAEAKNSSDLKKLVDLTQDCLKTGATCLSHCNELLAKGITNMAECQKSVMNMLAVCEALSKVAAYHNADEKLIKSLAKTCAEYCRACQKSCEKHAQHHAICKECMESCIACAKACESLT